MNKGGWSNNQKSGEGVFVYSDGTLFVGEFEKDRIVGGSNTPKETSDINVQVKLNLEDVLLRHMRVGEVSRKTDISINAQTSVTVHNLDESSISKTNATTATATAAVTTSATSATTGTGTATSAHHPTTHTSNAAAHPAHGAGAHTTTSNHHNENNHQHPHQHSHQHHPHLHYHPVVVHPPNLPSPFAAIVTELERLLLRYHTYSTIYFKKCSEMATRRRQREINLFTMTDSYVTAWPKVEQLLFQSRDIYKRFFCMSLEQIRRLFREIDLMGYLGEINHNELGSLSSYDLTTIIRRMKTHQKYVVV